MGESISAAVAACLEAGVIDEAALQRALDAQYPPHVGAYDHPAWTATLEVHRGRHPAHPRARAYWVCHADFRIGAIMLRLWIDLAEEEAS